MHKVDSTNSPIAENISLKIDVGIKRPLGLLKSESAFYLTPKAKRRRSSSLRHRLVQRTSFKLAQKVGPLPLSTNGVALGLVGLAGLWNHLSKEIPYEWVTAFLVWSSVPLCTISFTLVLTNLVRVVVCPGMVFKELKDPTTFFVAGATIMAANLCFAYLYDKGVEAASIGIYGCAVVQVLITIWFLALCVHQRCLPEPLWNPPTVSMAMIGWTGTAIGMDRTVVEVTFWIGFVLMAVSTPIQVWRVLRNPLAIAPFASVNMLQAPCSFMAVAWYSIRGLVYCPWLVVPLMASSTVVFFITCFAVFQRRKAIFQSDRPLVGYDWAAFTFPTLSTANAALSCWRLHTGPREKPAAVLWGCWTVALIMLASGITLIVAACHLPKFFGWFQKDRARAQKSGRIHTHEITQPKPTPHPSPKPELIHSSCAPN